MHRDLLRQTAELAIDYLDRLPERSMVITSDGASLRAAFGGPMPSMGEPALSVIDHLARSAEPGLAGTAAPRYFGFVIGGGVPASVAADWLTSTWDQNGGLYVAGPAQSVIEEVVAEWLLEIFGLPPGSGVGLVTGCQMANFTALAAARHAVLQRMGWDVERDGLQGAPAVNVVVSGESHVTIHIALQLLGLGGGNVRRVATDDQGRMRPDALREALGECQGPTIVCAQAGNVNSGSFDPFVEIVSTVREVDGAWLHVDAAFGMWALASPAMRHLATGIQGADSWATDAHKWLNVPYDSGLVFVRDADAQRRAMALPAAYLIHAEGAHRDPYEFVPEFSRRARGFALYAAMRSLGRAGIAEMVDRHCRQARRFAELLGGVPGVSVLNEVVLNQVLVRFEDPATADTAASDVLTRDVVRRVQEEGTCWLSGTTWHDLAAMRISVSNWATTDDDIDRSADAIVRCYAAATAG
ncbi:MAG: aspartate aminotransferase family protein [Chloroflexi bacterium]|nr:aspartate aminotransferase family protein [Chloroflexota bacterium]